MAAACTRTRLLFAVSEVLKVKLGTSVKPVRPECVGSAFAYCLQTPGVNAVSAELAAESLCAAFAEVKVVFGRTRRISICDDSNVII